MYHEPQPLNPTHPPTLPPTPPPQRVHQQLSSLLALPAPELSRLVCRAPFLLVEDAAQLPAKVQYSTVPPYRTVPHITVGHVAYRAPYACLHQT